MKKILAFLTVLTAIFCTACGHDNDTTDYGNSVEETQTVTKTETEPASELVEGDIIEIDGKKHKVVDFDDEIDAMYNTAASYIDLKESKIPEKLKTVPDNWVTVTKTGHIPESSC